METVIYEKTRDVLEQLSNTLSKFALDTGDVDIESYILDVTNTIDDTVSEIDNEISKENEDNFSVHQNEYESLTGHEMGLCAGRV